MRVCDVTGPFQSFVFGVGNVQTPEPWLLVSCVDSNTCMYILTEDHVSSLSLSSKKVTDSSRSEVITFDKQNLRS